MKIIEVRNLRKQYPGHLAVEDVSFEVAEGEIFGILGPNGAGKTTTVECVAGLRRRDGGDVRVAGLDPREDRDELRRVLGMQLQSAALPDKIKVWEAMDLYASFYPDPADWPELLDRVSLSAKRETLFKDLSGGQRQRLSVAMALVGRPRVAVLDELTTGLDPQARRDTWELVEQVRDTGVTIVLVTHFMEEAERLCDRIALIDAGKVAATDTPAGLIAQVGGEQKVRFRPSAPVDDAVLLALPEVREVTRTGPQIVVRGTGNLAPAVTLALAHHQVVPADLRIEQATLDDAFLALTGRKLS
ncbi:ABC-type multidrug transport system, ATPase component [[Actinomadura] parvosata subsp. kistnae]|uniref:Multidrug ABC transporter ATP-binding protein n=1 Tax=[Actinomadura] parvosata subsp. kistnae TaxID=1909395 RepID=A0A1V0ACD9_9ACTN|nr:ABC transporter ATP-binding protein [Nonomuraea sp. ATCC 55076]AQZ67888.1 multidrug ABC transporter ATP-binding protein [Nonomuraea sp. ATCC 55076]SPL93768.1 ABC-type multidrug transport system, ATPase component [Actinomadura parvosata subsp. kistnae]